MSFTLKRPNASKWDLPQANHDFFTRALEIAQSYNMRHRFSEAVLVNAIEEFGGERTCACVEAWCLRGMHDMTRFFNMLSGAEPLTFQKKTVNEMPMENRKGGSREPMKVSDFLPAAQGGEARLPRPAAPKKALPAGVMSEDDAMAYLFTIRKSGELLFEYFNNYGRDKNHVQYYQLKEEYR